MPIKDWTKTGKNEWHKYRSNGKKLAGNKFYDGIFYVKTVNGDYNVTSFYKKFPKEYKKGSIKTESQAIKIAKSYMRTH